MRSKRREVRGERRGKPGTVPLPIKWGLSPKGFSLAEVTIAAVILGISMLSIYGVYIKTFQASSRSEKKAVASALAQETMENIVNKPFDNVAVWAGSGTDPMPPDTFTFTNKDGSQNADQAVVKATSGTESDYAAYQQTISKVGVDFTVTTLITWQNDSNDDVGGADPDPNDYKRIHVTVSWPGNTSPVVLDRFISMYSKPAVHATGGSEAGEFQLKDSDGDDDDLNYVHLGSTSLELYVGGSRTSKAEAKGFSSENFNNDDDHEDDDHGHGHGHDDDNDHDDEDEGDDTVTEDNIAWVRLFTDDDASIDYLDKENRTESINTFSDSPIFFKSEAVNTAQASASSVDNTISSQSWHSGEFSGSDGWPDTSSDWPSPPSWAINWAQPSAIAKATLSTGMYWNYSPSQGSKKLFETGNAYAGSKSVITSEATNNKVVGRSWSKVDNVKLIETDSELNGIISIGGVEARIETEANGQDGGAQSTVFWRLTDFKVAGFANIPVVDSADDIAGITPLPAPIQSITVGQVTSTADADGKSAQASITAIIIEFNRNTSLISGVTIPASKITLGTAQTNVSYTTK